jgi:putative methionine-R-sulfoxide reductase with GAF domain
MLNSLRGRLTLVMIGLAIVPLMVVGALLAYRNFNSQEQQAEELQNQTALRVAQQVENLITTRPEEVILAARIRGMTTLGWTGQERALNDLLLYDPYLAELILLDSAGYEITRASTLAPTPAGPEVRDHSGQEAFVVPATTRETYYGPVYFDQATGEPFMTLGMPIMDAQSNELNTVLVARLRFKVVWDLIAAQNFSPGQDIYVVSTGTEQSTGQGGQGQEYVVAHRDPAVVLRGTAFDTRGGGATGRGLSGENVVLGIQRFQAGQQEFAVVSELTTQEAYKPAFQTLYLLLAGLVALVVVITVGGYFSLRQVTAPLATLANAAEEIGAGSLSVQVDVGGVTEIGLLGRAFNLMTAQLRDLIGSLEARVQARTRDLQVAAQVSKQVATILDPEQLLPQVAELTKEQFGLYHAQIYLLDESGDALILAAGTGEAARVMRQRGHRISSSAARSLVARAARDNQPAIVDNVIEHAGFLPNPILPDTRSEAALPLAVGDRMLGVLDVQSEQVNRFDADMLAVLSTLAAQIAVALENARLFSTVEQSSRHEQALGVITQQVQQATTIDEVLQVATRELGKALHVPYTAIELHMPQPERAVEDGRRTTNLETVGEQD